MNPLNKISDKRAIFIAMVICIAGAVTAFFYLCWMLVSKSASAGGKLIQLPTPAAKKEEAPAAKKEETPAPKTEEGKAS